MMEAPSRHLAVRGLVPRAAAAARLAAILALAGIGCTTASISGTGGAGGNGKGGGAGGSKGTGGVVVIFTSSVMSSGGTTGATATTLICNGTSTSGCKAQIPEGCGDSINNQGGIEQCDDGNVLPADGCNGACKVEPGWTCPPAGKCTRVTSIVCGEGKIGAGEVCDDGNTLDGDGCNATCTAQDPAYICVPGKACVKSSLCGNKRIEAGEVCDDGNPAALDGCDSACHLEGGFVCPNPGLPCKLAPRCGDRVVQPTIGEACDDGNQQDGDGCAADCQTKGAGCVCTPGQLCKCPSVTCGNGVLEGGEKCDDGNTQSGDGCAGDCSTVEKGYQCRAAGKRCTPKCGDGILLGDEECEFTTATPPAGCSSSCRVDPGYDCDPKTLACTPIVCGTGVTERGEQCDDGNDLPFDGCYQCRKEPVCSGGKCVSSCGDGQRFADEECDDGNPRSGDGCASTCAIEPGFTCTDLTADPPDTLKQPVLLRDFAGGNRAVAPQTVQPDFNNFGACPTLNMVQSTLGGDGRMVLDCPNGDCKQNPGAGCLSAGWDGKPDNFNQWYRAVDGINVTLPYEITLTRQADGTYKFDSDDPNTTTLEPFDPIGSGGLVGLGRETLAPANECGTARNVSFTTETHFWFEYQGGERFDFSGDDDVWVFANGKLVIDLGGLHVRMDGTFVLDADTDGNGPDTADGSAQWASPDGATHMNGAPSPSAPQRIALGMVPGGIYEVVVFQAERRQCESNFRITLKNFAKPLSECVSRCGDGVVVGEEECDCGDGKVTTPSSCPGPNGQPDYNGCTAECKWGPFCGDGKVTNDEQCDNGGNNDDYGAQSGCAAGCKLPPRCGDGIVQTDFDEECDEGAGNQKTSDAKVAYGGCMANCKRGGRCGDGVVNLPETCDDGVNDGTYGTCNPDCTPAPKCGDATVQPEYGEECEPVMSNDPNCTQACRKPGGCGDGLVTPPEQCDDGALFNTGEYGACAPSCIFAPHCGDGVVNGPEECDDGMLDGSYGGCTAQCKLAPHCGDRILNGSEECDHGADNGKDGLCTATCKTIIYAPP